VLDHIPESRGSAGDEREFDIILHLVKYEIGVQKVFAIV